MEVKIFIYMHDLSTYMALSRYTLYAFPCTTIFIVVMDLNS